jgi:hypothetical protein
MDAHVGGDYAQEGPAGVFDQDFHKHIGATIQLGGSHVHHGFVSLHRFGLARMYRHPLHSG